MQTTGPHFSGPIEIYFLKREADIVHQREIWKNIEKWITHFFCRFKYVAAEKVAGWVASDVTKDFQILRVVRHVENSDNNKNKN